MRIERRFTTMAATAEAGGIWAGIGLVARASEECSPMGERCFHHDRVETPEGWSQIAADLLAQSCFRREGIAVALRRIPEEGVPDFLWRSAPDEAALAQLPPGARYTGETSARQVIERMTGAWAYQGWKRGYFESEADARIWLDEMRLMLALQMASPSLAAWRMTGLDWAYGIEAEEEGAETAPAPRRLALPQDRAAVEAELARALRAAADRAALSTGRRVEEEAFAGLRAALDAQEGEGAADPVRNPALAAAIRAARRAGLPEGRIAALLEFAADGGSAPFAAGDENEDDAAEAPLQLALPEAFFDAVAEGEGQGPHGHLGRIAQLLWQTGAPQLAFPDTEALWATTPDTLLPAAAAPRATLNLLAFLTGERIDGEALAHAARLWTIALDIMAEERAGETNPQRLLALGHGNLAALLMHMGLPYDSAQGRALAAALTALMTGVAYATSAELAGRLGAFADYPQHFRAMQAVIARHRAAALGRAPGRATPLDAENSPQPDLVTLVQLAWDEAQELGEIHGYRNAQVTAITRGDAAAPLMEGFSPGLEAPNALIWHEKHGEEDYARIINPAVPEGLAALGYSPRQIRQIVAHVIGHGSLAGAPGVNHTALIGHGFGPEEIDRIEAALPQVFDIRCVFNQWTLGRDFCQGTLGIPAEKLMDPGFNLLCHLGFTPAQVAAANAHACGHQSLEGAPHLHPWHLSVFDGTRPSGPSARRIAPKAHLAMIAAVQPFVSAPVERTIPLPGATTLAELRRIIAEAHALGLRSLSLRREEGAEPPLAREETSAGLRSAEPLVAPGPRGQRARLPERRKGYTQKASIGGQKVYLRTGEYADGSLGEIFIDMHKQDDGFRAMLNNFAIAVSLGLQYGVPLEEFVEAFRHTRFEPAGAVLGNDSVKTASSVLDYIFRELAISYLGRGEPDPAPEGQESLTRGAQTAGEARATEPSVARAVELLKSISSTGYLRQRLPGELLALGRQAGGGKAGAGPDGASGPGANTSGAGPEAPRR